MHFSHSLATTATPAKIWSIWTDVEGWPTWDTELSRAALDGDFAVHARGTLKPLRGPSSTFVITSPTPGQGYAFMTRLPLCRLTVQRTLDTDGAHTGFTHAVRFDGPLSFLWGRALGRRYQRMLPQVMERIRLRAEQPRDERRERSALAPGLA